MESARDPLEPAGSQEDASRVHDPLDRYQLDVALGRSPHAATWIAIDREAPDRRRVVLKLFNPAYTQLIGPVDAFERQLEAARGKTDSLLPRLERYWWHDGKLVVIFERCDGEPLDQIVASSGRPLPVATRHALVHSLARAGHELHAAGFLHLGLVPSVISYDRVSERARLIDWGLMLPLSNVVGESAPLPGIGMGAAPYASSELLSGGQPDARDDLYAIACIAHELVSGSHPYGRRTAREAATVGLVPAPVPHLNWTQSTRLINALRPVREDRSVTLDELASAFADVPQSATPQDFWRSLKLRALQPGFLMRFLGAVAILIGVGIAYTNITGNSAPSSGLVATPSSARTQGTRPTPSAPSATPVDEPVAARDTRSASEPTASRAARELPPVPPTGLPPDRARSVTPDIADSAAPELAAPARTESARIESIEPAPAVPPAPPPVLAPAPATEAAADARARPELSQADPRSQRPQRAPETSQPSVQSDCPKCDCASIAFKRAFTTDPIRVEEQRFFARNCTN